ncbi:MAG: DNA polymerase III subunit beta [Bacteroidota bacterium]
MKFSVSSSLILKQLSAINGVIGGNTLIPILENFLFKLEDGVLTAISSDLQTVMITSLEVDSKDQGSIAVPARLLLETLRSLPEQPVAFNVDEETFGIELITENGRYKLAGENPIDFPKTPTVNKNLSVEMPANTLSSAISNTIFAASNDDLRPAMTGIYLMLTNEKSTFVATDGHKLVRIIRTDVKSTVETNLIIPKKALNLLKSTLPADSSAVVADFGSSHACFSFGNIQMYCRLIDERYPDFNNAIPTQNPNVLSINRQEFLNALKRISIFSNKTTHQIRLKLGDDTLVLSAEDIDYSNEANEKLICDYEGEPLDIGFNAKFLAEMIGNLSCKSINLEMSAPNRAGLIIPKEQVENEDLLMLIMPVMLNNYNS